MVVDVEPTLWQKVVQGVTPLQEALGSVEEIDSTTEPTSLTTASVSK